MRESQIIVCLKSVIQGDGAKVHPKAGRKAGRLRSGAAAERKKMSQSVLNTAANIDWEPSLPGHVKGEPKRFGDLKSQSGG